jgi:DNA-binding transcriptional regulator LsrR (DeoR family)
MNNPKWTVPSRRTPQAHINKVRALLGSGMTQKAVAEKLDVSFYSVGAIINKHIPQGLIRLRLEND